MIDTMCRSITHLSCAHLKARRCGLVLYSPSPFPSLYLYLAYLHLHTPAVTLFTLRQSCIGLAFVFRPFVAALVREKRKHGMGMGVDIPWGIFVLRFRQHPRIKTICSICNQRFKLCLRVYCFPCTAVICSCICSNRFFWPQICRPLMPSLLSIAPRRSAIHVLCGLHTCVSTGGRENKGLAKHAKQISFAI